MTRRATLTLANLPNWASVRFVIVEAPGVTDDSSWRVPRLTAWSA